MIETPYITQSAAQSSAVLHLTVPLPDIRREMGRGLEEMRRVLREQGISPTGPWFTHHLKGPAEVFDFEISFPVSVEVQASGRVRAGHLPSRRVARTVYHGPYEGLPEAWAEFMDWIDAQGLETTEDFWECYVIGFEDTDNPANYRTELNRPLAL